MLISGRCVYPAYFKQDRPIPCLCISGLSGTGNMLTAAVVYGTSTLVLLQPKHSPMAIWTYGIQLWGCAKPSNTKIVQRFESSVLRTITNAPLYVSNFTLHNDLQIPFITEEIKRYSNIYCTTVRSMKAETRQQGTAL
jgi:hypothetical protein